MMVLGGKLEHVVGTRLDSKVVLPAVTVKKSCFDSTQDANTEQVEKTEGHKICQHCSHESSLCPIEVAV